MMRVIDSDAINKRVFADIANTFQHSSKITGEKIIQNLSGTDDPKAAAVDNFNFNGIEFSKIKQLINYMQTHKKKFGFDRQLVEISNNKKKSTQFFTFEEEGNTADDQQEDKDGIIINSFETKFEVPSEFDGRSSFIYPRFVIVYADNGAVGCDIDLNTGAGWTGWTYATAKETLEYEHATTSYHFYKPSLAKSARFGLTEKKIIFDKGEFIKCWGASIDDSDGNNCIIIDKQKRTIKITTSANLSFKNIGFDRSGTNRAGQNNSYYILNDNQIIKVYLDIFFMYWRDK